MSGDACLLDDSQEALVLLIWEFSSRDYTSIHKALHGLIPLLLAGPFAADGDNATWAQADMAYVVV